MNAYHNILKNTCTLPVSDLGETTNLGAAIISALRQHQLQLGKSSKVLKAKEVSRAPHWRRGRFCSLKSVNYTEAFLNTLQPWEPRRYLEVNCTRSTVKNQMPFHFQPQSEIKGILLSADSEFHMKRGLNTSRCLQWRIGGTMAGHKAPHMRTPQNPSWMQLITLFLCTYVKVYVWFFKILPSKFLLNMYQENSEQVLVYCAYYSSETRQPDKQGKVC